MCLFCVVSSACVCFVCALLCDVVWLLMCSFACVCLDGFVRVARDVLWCLRVCCCFVCVCVCLGLLCLFCLFV